MDDPMQTNKDKPAPDGTERPVIRGSLLQRLHPEVAGEIVLLLIVAAFFISFYLESRQWTLGAALMPRIVFIIAAPLWLVRFFVVVKHLAGVAGQYRGVRREEESGGEIMDLGFYVGDDEKAALRRFIGITSSIVLLVAGVWAIGWHTALPLWTFGYLMIYARVKLWQAALGGLFFLAIILGMYDAVFNSIWNEPVLFRLFN